MKLFCYDAVVGLLIVEGLLNTESDKTSPFYLPVNYKALSIVES